MQNGPGAGAGFVPAGVAEARQQLGQDQIVALRLGVFYAALHGSELPVAVDDVLDGGPIGDPDLLSHVGDDPGGGTLHVAFVRLQTAENHIEQG